MWNWKVGDSVVCESLVAERSMNIRMCFCFLSVVQAREARNHCSEMLRVVLKLSRELSPLRTIVSPCIHDLATSTFQMVDSSSIVAVAQVVSLSIFLFCFLVLFFFPCC